MSTRSMLDRGRAPEPGPVKPFDFPTVHRNRPGGEQTPELLVASHGDLPLVTAEVIVRGGADAEPPELAGVARLTAEALEAGTTTRDVDALAWELERLGIEIETAASWDAASIGITVHADRLEPAMALLADVVRNPSFPADQVERLRDEQLADILQRRKEPGALASDAAARFVFDDGVPYGRPLIGREDTVRALGPEQLRTFHRERYTAGSAAIIVTGRVDPEHARAVVEQHFGDWRGAAAMAGEFRVRPRREETTVYVVDRPGSVQSELRLAHVGVDRRTADYFPLVVMNTILGGAFTSRLNMSLRERHGYTYGIRSGFAFRRQPGPFTVDAAVATEVTAPAIEAILTEIRELREDGPTDDEMDAARDYLRGIFPLRLETTSAVAGRLAELVVFGLPADYFASYRDRIAAVSRNEVLRVASEAVRPDRMAVIVVGDAERVADPLRELGIGTVEIHQRLP